MRRLSMSEPDLGSDVAALIGEGTAEIQKMIIGRRLVRDYPAGA